MAKNGHKVDGSPVKEVVVNTDKKKNIAFAWVSLESVVMTNMVLRCKDGQPLLGAKKLTIKAPDRVRATGLCIVALPAAMCCCWCEPPAVCRGHSLLLFV